jgi:release factor glutamine methyltransferase
MGLDQAALLRDRAASAPPGYDALLERRAGREPVALILGRQGFWTLDLEVSAATLIPRADTETLIEAAIGARPDRGVVRRVLDLGTGTGCLLLAALAEFRDAWGLGIDVAYEAAALAARNARRNGLDGRAAFAVADWATPVAGTFDLVLSNPPYIRAGEIDALMPEVARHEPRRALDGGADGLDAYRMLLDAVPACLAPGGLAVLELGAGQANAVGALAEAAGYRPAFRADLGGTPRAVLFEKNLGRAPPSD